MRVFVEILRPGWDVRWDVVLFYSDIDIDRVDALVDLLVNETFSEFFDLDIHVCRGVSSLFDLREPILPGS